MTEELMSLKSIAINFLKLAASGKAKEAFKLYVGPHFKHHNPYFKGDAISLMNAMDQSAEENPDKIFEIQRSLQDQNLVAIHSFIKQNPNDTGAVTMHIFKFEGDHIIELWDFGQPILANSINENGML